jgi:ferredoxin
LQDGKIVYPEFGVGTGEGSSRGNCPTYKIKIINHYVDQEIEVEVPEDRWGC